jgi:hypothetical protein
LLEFLFDGVEEVQGQMSQPRQAIVWSLAIYPSCCVHYSIDREEHHTRQHEDAQWCPRSARALRTRPWRARARPSPVTLVLHLTSPRASSSTTSPSTRWTCSPARANAVDKGESYWKSDSDELHS